MTSQVTYNFIFNILTQLTLVIIIFFLIYESISEIQNHYTKMIFEVQNLLLFLNKLKSFEKKTR